MKIISLLRLLVPRVYLEETFPLDMFFRNHEPNCVLKMSLSFLENMHSFSFTIFRAPFKRIFGLVHDTNVHKNLFNPEYDNNFYEVL